MSVGGWGGVDPKHERRRRGAITLAGEGGPKHEGGGLPD